MNKILTVYNICEKTNPVNQPNKLYSDNIDNYIKSINSILDQSYPAGFHKVVVSACMNSVSNLNILKNEFGNKIEIVRYNEPYTVNITFNKTVQECIKKYGIFDGYLYVESGVIFYQYDFVNNKIDENDYRNKNILGTIDNTMNIKNEKNEHVYSMITIQVSIDSGLGEWFRDYDSLKQTDYYLRNQDLIVPVGRATNLHCQLFTDELYMKFEGRIIPDVFKAHCTESVFSFLNASIMRKWVVLPDLIIYHNHNVDGSSAYFEAQSILGGSWNNLLYGRNASDFINDPEAIDAGLGYEEIRKIMVHKADIFDENGFSKDHNKLKAIIKKYLYLRKDELDYDKINVSWM